MVQLPTCKILGVRVCVTDMEQVKRILKQDYRELRGKYICVSNVHTTVMAHDDPAYLKVQNGAAYVLPDGKPLSLVSKRRGFSQAKRVAGPDLMGEMFRDAETNGTQLRHFFYGGSKETLEALEKRLRTQYPNLKLAGFYSPPFRPLTDQEDEEAVQMLNDSGADIVWVGLGAPKQENWMAAHAGRVNAVMLGVGAGFDFHAGTVKRAPKWMQKLCLEWLYRLMQDPKRLWKRYVSTNFRFLRLAGQEGRMIKKRGKQTGES